MDSIDTQIVSVHADTSGFQTDVAAMRAALDPLTASADRVGRQLTTSLLKATDSGKLGFADLQKTALSALDQIATGALQAGVQSVIGGGGLGGLLAGLLGAPGRATGGPVSPGRPYMVGERGPELFVPTSAGSIAATPAAAVGRTAQVSITINAPAASTPALLQQSSRQVARAVKAALG